VTQLVVEVLRENGDTEAASDDAVIACVCT